MVVHVKWLDWIPKMDYGSLACCTLAFLLYCNTLDSEFVYDDRRAILTNPDIQPKTPWPKLLENDYWGTPLTDSGTHGSYRPLTVLTFRFNYLIGEFVSWGYHLVNVILHCSATYLLMKIANIVLPKSRRNIGCVVTGALFAAHPVHTEAVANVVGRADLLACNFFLISLLAYSSHMTHRDSNCCSKSCDHKPAVPKSSQKRYEKIATTLQKSVTSCNWTKNKIHYREVTPQNSDSCNNINLPPSKWCCWWTIVKMWWYILVFLLLAIASMLSKETGITVLGVSFVYDLVYSKNRKKRQKKSFLLLSVAILLILIARLQAKVPEFSTADNPSAKEPNWSIRLMTLSYLPLMNFMMLLHPSALSFDWGMDAVPRIQSVRDPKVFFTLCFYFLISVVVGKCGYSLLEKRGWLGGSYKVTIKQGCLVCHRRNSDSHTHNCRMANNNNTTQIQLCLCSTEKRKPEKISSREATLFSLSLIILPFLPASNLFFYVGFVVAERVLYIPSAGFCLLVGIASAKLWKNKTTRGYFCAGFVLVLIGFSAKTVLRNRDWKNEEELYKSAIPFNPPKAYGNLGSILSAKGRSEEAEDSFRKALAFRPNMADVHYNLAILLQSKQKLDEAIQSYQRAIHFRPSLALAYVNLGTALIASGRCEEAAAVLRQASKLDGTGLRDRKEHENAKISALLQLGALYSDQGRLHSALATYREAVDNLPAHYPPQKIYNILGETLAKLQQDEEAEKWYRAALEAEPDHVPAHITYGKLLAKNVSRSVEAEQWFRRAQRLAPNDPSVYHHYGAFLVINQRYNEASNMYERAAELLPEDFELAVAAATAMRKAGRQEAAERWYRKSVKMRPSDPRGHTNLGAMLHLNGKYKEAERSYRKALRLQPDDETTLTNLHRLYGIMT
ncbi:protein O-mannosyl-transferase Tmtc2-like [Euwallacea similis]|uniref:protein O-mannosyl-transferase Tmtc2-like n=1 Tax=Euwallacea similis TaxID=1736056 RepID=UPI00344BC8DF